MNYQTIKSYLAPFFILLTLTCLMTALGCARYARDVNTIYEPTASVKGGSGDVYIVIPANRQTSSPGVKWVLGTVKNDDNQKIDEITSPRSPEEIMQEAFSLEFKKAGYNVILATKLPADAQRAINLTKTEIELDQITDIADLIAKCRVFVAADIYVNGQMVKKFQYESKSSKTDIKDRDTLAKVVLEDAMHSVMLKAMPELNDLFKK